MVQYQCKNCKKEFTDRTKYTYHINRIRPCIPFGSLLMESKKNEIKKEEIKNEKNDKKSDFSDDLSKNCSATFSKKSGKNIPHLEIKTPILAKKTEEETHKKIDKIYTDMIQDIKFDTNKISCICRICHEQHSCSFMEHLLEKHDILKEDRQFSFIKKNSGLVVYEKEENCGDIVILLFNHHKCLLFTTTNIHNLQRHKKEKYDDIMEMIYYPCKDIKRFKEMWKEQLYKMKIYDDKKKLDSHFVYQWTKEIIENINGEKEKKTIAEYKSYTYFKCPLCDFKDQRKNEMESHISKNHKSNELQSKFVVNDIHRDKIMQIIEKNNNNIIEKQQNTVEEYKCNLCDSIFTNRFNLRRHMKENCKNAELLVISNYQKQAEYLSNNIYDLIKSNELLKEENEKLREVLIGNQELIKGNNETMKNSVNYINNTTNIIQNNILFNINDFGQEDISHIQYQFVEGIIKDMNTDSLVKFIEEVHYGNPRNCNVMIPTNIPSIQDNNMLLIKKGDRWIVDKRKNVIDGMLTVNMDRIVDVYEDISEQLKPDVKSNFEGYVNTMEAEDNERVNAIQKTEQLLLDHKPTNNLLLENCKIQQNNYIGNKLVGSVELTLPQQSSYIQNEEKDKILDMMNKPTMVDLEDSLKSFQLPR